MSNPTTRPDALPPLKLWGGIEPTINRVQDQYMSQDTRTHHSQRIKDLDQFASLGIKTMRYPVLWEATAPEGVASANWAFADERLPRLRELGIRPIVGLVHHGSGPRYTSLTDPEFPDKLAEYALAVATRFPWVKDWTPVNETMTTAAFRASMGCGTRTARMIR
jgi:dTDP-4-dehydrorhamnose reductase